VVVLRGRDAVALRAKVTVKLAEPQTQAVADQTAEACAELVRNVVREAPDAASVLGYEAAIAAEVVARLANDPAVVRSVEVAGLHIIGDLGHVAVTHTAPGDTPAWLHAVPSSLPTSSDARPIDRGDRPTPVHAFPTKEIGAAPRGMNPTPVQPIPVVKRGAPAPIGSLAADRPTPLHNVPALHGVPAPHGSPPVDRPTPLHGVPAPHGSPPVDRPTPLHGVPAPHGSPPAGGSRPDPTPGPPVARARDPFAATAPSVVPPEDSTRARPLWGGASSPAHAGPSTRPPPPPSRPGSTLASMTRPPSGSHLAAVRSPDSRHGSPSSARLSGPPSSVVPAGGPPSSSGSTLRAASRPPPAAIAMRRRAVASRLALPVGAGPYEVARALTPLFRDTAARILVGFLRAYDLTVIRRVSFDGVENDILSSLTAPSDGAAGTYAASHAAEIHRWQEAFGATKMDQLQREANLAAAALGYEMFSVEGVSQSTTNAIVEGLAGSAFADPDLVIELGRYLYTVNATTSAEALTNMIEVAGEEMPPGLETALDPLFESLRDDIAAAALIVKDVMEAV